MSKESAPRASLHDRIRSDLEGKILSGAWPPGHRIPTEQELRTEYGCSRMTVNKVMTQLANAGLVLRRRKTGSIVMPQQSQNAVLEIKDIKDEVTARGGVYRHAVIDRTLRKALPGEAGELGIEAGTEVLALICLHYADEEPFCLEDRVINLEVAPAAREESFAELAPGVWLLRHIPWSEAEHTIAAVGATARVAKLLDLTAGTPCLVMERRTWRQGETVTEVRLTYPGAANRLSARFTPSLT
ncbi:histidine utilization repressor [Salipiger mangrovisoli]|uniref:Histidine utilization repressor n=1 Tax=Salipiger mangrovisoli TaxID=2865933 RepID=A0ABR9X6V7_9RHOB|nr:histidine utilization repressor [Salipiger mangrovisoli]MBE9639340.1 histidine utilization repressor [Salipiger mangrovisoli]